MNDSKALFKIVELNPFQRDKTQKSNNSYKNPKRAIALGMMDGVHLGHKQLIKTCLNFAKTHGLLACATTFAQAPIKWTNPDKKIESITSLEERLLLFKEQGLNEAIVFDFPQLALIEAEQYLNQVLLQELNVDFIACGPNHSFGKKQENLQIGDVDLLTSWSRANQVTFEEVGFVNKSDALSNNTSAETSPIISSSLIRKCLREGDLKNANQLLGHNFFIFQPLVAGQQLGQKLGFPTLNFDYDPYRVRLPLGVYAARLWLQQTSYIAAVNLGHAPTVARKADQPVLEAHLLNIQEELQAQLAFPTTGESIKVELLEFIRPEREFESLEALKTQIEKDCQKILLQLHQ